MLVHSLETFGTQDGPGIRLVVFLQGCGFTCVYCQNPDTQSMTNDQVKQWTVDQIIDQLEKMRPYFKNGGGLTVSGGEPTLQAVELVELFTACRQRGFHTALDTGGGIFTEMTQRLYDITDLVILDVKHIDPNWHQKITGAALVNPLRNAEYRESTSKPLWLRYVLVPGWSDQPEHLKAWAKKFHDYRSVERVEILPYHTLGAYKYQLLGKANPLAGVKPPTTKVVNQAKQIFEQYFDQVVVR